MGAVRVNGKIAEVKQSALRLILRWVTIWEHFVFFQFGYDWQKY